MKVKLKKETLDLGGLCSTGSHQGFPKDIWMKLNNGETIEIDNIPFKAKNQVEEVTLKVKSGGKSSSKKGGK